MTDLTKQSYFDKMVSVAKALLTGENVSQETLEKRLEICRTCELAGFEGDTMRCTVCGCKLKGDKSLINLARYVETGWYGCKHPEGSKWAKAGLSK